MDTVNEKFIWKTEAQLLALKNSIIDKKLSHFKKNKEVKTVKLIY